MSDGPACTCQKPPEWKHDERCPREVWLEEKLKLAVEALEKGAALVSRLGQWVEEPVVRGNMSAWRKTALATIKEVVAEAKEVLGE